MSRIRTLLWVSLAMTAITASCRGELAPSTDGSELGATWLMPEIGYSMDYPAEWTYCCPNSAREYLAELESDRDLYQDPRQLGEVAGLMVFLYLSYHPDSMVDPTPEDLLAFNMAEFGWQDPETAEASVFGVPALRVQYHVAVPTQDDLWADALIGMVGDRSFALVMQAPTREQIEEAVPLWEQMIESIALTDG